MIKKKGVWFLPCTCYPRSLERRGGLILLKHFLLFQCQKKWNPAICLGKQWNCRRELWRSSSLLGVQWAIYQAPATVFCSKVLAQTQYAACDLPSSCGICLCFSNLIFLWLEPAATEITNLPVAREITKAGTVLLQRDSSSLLCAFLFRATAGQEIDSRENFVRNQSFVKTEMFRVWTSFTDCWCNSCRAQSAICCLPASSSDGLWGAQILGLWYSSVRNTSASADPTWWSP